jgi:predicted NBD/HSP70 family sugar kinase
VTGLSPNAVSLIVGALEGAGLLLKEEPVRGRIGQPSTPVRLNPDARSFFGLKIGRRSTDLVLVDFVGRILAQRSEQYNCPRPDKIRGFLKSAMRSCLKKGRRAPGDVHGFGIAIPTEIWGWSEDIGIPAEHLAVWRDLDPASLLPKDAPWSPIVVNDATAACIAETTFARTGDLQDAMYLFVGTLIGGGVILNGSVFTGRSGNAGGFGPLRVPGGSKGSNRLIDHASLIVLERLLREANQDGLADPWTSRPDIVERWIDLSARGIAHAIASSLSVIDFQAIIIDGSFPENVRSALVSRVREEFLSMDLQGLTVPDISAGHFGSISRAVGAAALPLNESYAINQNTLMRGL